MYAEKRENTSSRDISISKVWGNGDFVHVCFESQGCRFRKQGYCVMCDYGAGRNITAEEAIESLDRTLKQWPVPARRLLLGTCGSILDEAEMDRKTLGQILTYLCTTDIDYFIFETHYSTVSDSVLTFLKRMLPGKKIAVEMGFESADPGVLKYSLKKNMNLEQLKHSVGKMKEYGIDVILNVFLGAPGLSAKEQLRDALNSVNWAYACGACEVVIFPANIKPGTRLWEMYHTGEYKRISHWLLVELLDRLPDEQLGAAAISWYGDRQESGIDMDIIPPEACDECRPLLMKFYQEFMRDFSAFYRRILIKELKEAAACECSMRLQEELYGGTQDGVLD